MGAWTNDQQISDLRDHPAFAAVGESVRIFPWAKIVSPERVTLGAHAMVDDFVFIGHHEKLVIGNRVHIASHTSITGGGCCYISDFVNVSSGVRIFSGTDDFDGGGLAGPVVPAEYRNVTRSSVTIGPHCIIGANSVVLPGVTIGEGATIGAGSVVTRDLAPWAIYVGAPARKLRDRPRERIEELERLLYATHGHPAQQYRFGRGRHASVTDFQAPPV
jgi:galactoside O-acetyltransferase